MLRATMDDSDGLLPGMFARLVIDLNKPIAVVTVPETAVSYSLHGNTIYVVREIDGQLRVQPHVVQTGDARDGRIAIIDGLNGDERVVTAGQNKLRRDAHVVIDESVKF
jgi:membrane fusion protein (multidrug efflux system)